MSEKTNKKNLLIVSSYHHHNTEKIAKIFANILHAEIKKPKQIDLKEIQKYNLIGFGSGIYSEKHHQNQLEMANKLPQIKNKKAFIFSTSGITSKRKMTKDHDAIRNILVSKGYEIIDEFQCKGFNTNSFLKYLGGMNKGRPNAEDLINAKEFAIKIKKEQNLS